MRALVWHGRHDMRYDTVPDPVLVNPRDAIIRITATAICGSDLHMYDGLIPSMKAGDVVGHEFMGAVVDVGSGNTKLKKGDRVVVPFVIACGSCFFCKNQFHSACDNSNPAETQDIGDAAYGRPAAGLFGYSHMTGGYAGGQAEYARVPYSDVGPIKIPDGVPDEKVLFLSDILPTGWMAAENANIQPGDTVAVWGCGPVGLFAIQSAMIMGAEKIIAIDHYPNRLALARQFGAQTLNYDDVNVLEAIDEITGGRGPDSCIDAVGMEAHGMTLDNIIDTVKTTTKLGTDRPHVIREAAQACRKAGTLSIPGVYAGFADAFPIGAVMEKGLTIRSGQTHVQKYTDQLLQMILEDRIDTTFLISHRMNLSDGPEGYRLFKKEQDSTTKVVMRP